MFAPQVRGALILGSVLVFASACGGSGSEPTGTTNGTNAAAVAVVSGNGQTGLIGTALSLPLVVKVTTTAGTVVPGATVNFVVTVGAASVSPASAITDAAGQARTVVTFGSSAGGVVVTATVAGTSLSTTFNLVAGTSTTASACSTGGAVQSPAAGTVLPGVSGTGICLSGGTSGADYALVAFNSNPDSSLAVTNFSVRSAGIVPLTTADVAPSANVVPTSSALRLGRNAQQRFDMQLRETARRELAARIPAARAWRNQRTSSGASFNAIPSSLSIGQTITLNANGNQACDAPINVRARVVATSNTAIIVADSANPTGGFTDAEYASFATTFDTLINPLDVNAFGQPTDIDRNGKILILFTKEVNKLTPRGSDGVIGGFTFERDLFPIKDTVIAGTTVRGCAGSNQGEMFYMLVPDPAGVFSDSRSKSGVSNLTAGTLAHEYQHLINAARRIYINDADDFETVWLNEGLSHIAEELLYYRLSGKSPRQNIGVNDIINDQATYFNNQGDNLSRFQIFLGMPSQTGVYAANDSLETRGADWNLLRYLADHRGSSDADTWQLLDNSKVEGLNNLAGVFGTNIMTQIRDWATSVYSDDVAGVTDPRFLEPSWNHRSIFPHLCIDSNTNCTTLNKYPLQLTPLSDQSPATVPLVAGGAAYFRFTVPAGTQASIDWTSGGLPVSPLVQFTVVRSK
ncbi:MAG TPA: hypothetical protein VN706_25455 [Gemmatimonadaceae bacterium]|nr:hypothetical protein [Gemmatimonadaceae bacterium]